MNAEDWAILALLLLAVASLAIEIWLAHCNTRRRGMRRRRHARVPGRAHSRPDPRRRALRLPKRRPLSGAHRAA